MHLKKNIIANYVGTGIYACAQIFALPWYLGELGSKQFGLIGLIAMLQTILGLLDAGISQALVREMAASFDQTDRGRRNTASLLFGYERIYWLFAVAAGTLLALSANTVATNWLNLDGLPTELGRQAVYGAAAIFMAQFPASIYRSLLMGVQAQVVFNSILSISSILRHVGGVLIIMIWPTLFSYLIWHISLAFLETLARSVCAWRVLQIKRSQVKWDSGRIRASSRLVIGMSIAALVGALTVQMDKIILSKMVSVEQFGYYTIAATAALAALQVIAPITQAALPRAIQLRHSPNELHNLNIKLLGSIILMIVLAASLFAIVGKWLIEIWLGDSVVVEIVYPILSVLLIGTGLNALYNIGYVNWLVHKQVKRVLQVNVVSLLLAVSLIPPLVERLGIIGAAASWLMMNLFGFILSLGWLKKR